MVGETMMNQIWALMIIVGIIYGVLSGNMEAVSESVLESSKEAVSLCITMCGITAMWTGIMKIGENSGLVEKMTKGIGPFVSFLFPRIPKNHKAREHISMNIIANVLGLGWAATPAGLQAMESLAQLEKERGNEEYIEEPNGKRKSFATKRERSASREMCVFLILNISSLQLIPVNMIAYRSQYGSVNPAGIIAPAIVATLFSTLVAVVYCKIKDRK